MIYQNRFMHVSKMKYKWIMLVFIQIFIKHHWQILNGYRSNYEFRNCSISEIKMFTFELGHTIFNNCCFFSYLCQLHLNQSLAILANGGHIPWEWIPSCITGFIYSAAGRSNTSTRWTSHGPLWLLLWQTALVLIENIQKTDTERYICQFEINSLN